MGGVPGPTPWSIWKKRIAIFLIGPMLVMSGAIIALGSHIEAPLLTTSAASPQTVQPGGTAIYPFVINNQGAASRFEFFVTNTNTADFSYVLTDAAGVPLTDTNADGRVDISLSAHATQEIHLRVTANPLAPFLSSTTTSVQTQRRGGSVSNLLSFVTRVGEGGPVTLDKSSDDLDGSVLIGQEITYSIDFGNPYSTQTVTAFAVTDTLDSDVTVDPGSITGGGVYDSGAHRIVWSLGDLDPSEAGSVSYTATVELVGNQTQIVNTAVADGSNVASASDSVILTVAAPVLVTFAKSVDDASPTPGGEIVYTINYEIQGDADLDNFTVTDTYDPLGIDVTSISGSPTSHNSTSGVIVWDLGTVSPGESGSFFITATVVGGDGQTFANTAEATGDQIPSASDSALFTVLAEADLSISKTDLADPVKAGESFAYSVTVTNTGPNPAEDVRVTDDLPAGLTFFGASGASCAATPQGFECDLGNLATSTTVNFQVTVTVDPGVASGTVLTNSVTVTSATLDPDQSSNVSTENTAVIEESNLIVSKTDGLGSVAAGTGPHTYTITIVNEGPSNAQVTLTDDWPAAFQRTALSCAPTAGAATGTGDFTCDLGTLAPGATFTVTATYVVSSDTAPGTYTNTATVSPVASETDTTDNAASDSTSVTRQFDLIVSKSDGPVAPVAGDGVEYQYNIIIFNAGPSDALNVQLTDDWPAGFFRTGVSCALSSGLALGTGDFSCNLGTIAAGTTRTVAATYTVPATTGSGLQTNTVTVAATGETNLPNNTAFDETFVSELSSLVVDKTDGQTEVASGTGPYTYTITVFNEGPSEALLVQITDDWPSELNRTAVSGCTGASLGTGDFSCTIASIGPGATATVTVTYNVPSSVTGGLVTNTVTATTASDSSPNSDSDSTLIVEETDLEVVKTGPAQVVAGTGGHTYTITVFNAGPSDAAAVSLIDAWPAEFDRTTVSGCFGATLGTADFTCTIASIPAGTTATVTVTFDVSSDVETATVTNTVTGTSTTETDPSDNADEAVTLIVEQTDLVVDKTGPAQVVAGTGGYTYTITVFNAGPSDAYDVTVTDDWPGEFTRTGVTGCTGASLGTGDFTCSIASILVGTTATVTVTFDVAADIDAATVTNTVTATSTSETDPFDNSDAFATEVVEQTDLIVTKDDGVTTLVAGDGSIQTFTITVFNAGPSDADAVTLTDVWPSGYLRLDTSDSCNNPTGTGPFSCSLGTIAPGTTSTVTATYTVPATTAEGPYTNTATVVASPDTDTNSSDNTDSDTNTVVEQTDLVVTKDDGVTTLVAGDGSVQTFTITVFNAGPSDATSVTVSDVWPSGYLRLDASDACSSQTGTGPFTCSLGTIAAGTTATVTATYTVPSNTPAGDYTNTATVVASPDTETNPTDNTDSDTNTVVEESDLVVTKTGPAQVTAGTTGHTYTITIFNAGPSDAFDVLVDDTWPTELTRTGVSGCSAISAPTGTGDFTCTIASIPAGTTATVVATFDVASDIRAQTVTNTVLATSATETDPSDNMDDFATVIVEETDLEVTKTGPAQVTAGTTGHSYTIIIFNAGPSDAYDVLVGDTWPSEFTRTGVTGCTGISAPTGTAGFTCTIASIPAGTTATVVATFDVASDIRAQTVTNTVLATSATETDPSDNMDDFATVIVEETDLVVEKDDGVDTLVAGDGSVQTFTITVTNTGPSDAYGVSLQDEWPSGYVRLSASPTCDDQSGTGPFACTLGTIAAGETVVVTATYEVPSDTRAGSYTNTATATASPNTETNPSDNTDSDINAVIEETDLVVTKDDGVTEVIAGTGPYTYTVTVFNAGPSDAYDVILTDGWPSQFERTGVSCTITSGTADGTAGFECSLGTIPSGTTITVTATYNVPASIPDGPVTNTVTATTSTETEPTDNTASDVNDVITRADLVVVKTDTPDPAAVLTGITYRVTVTNQGPSDANQVVLVDDLDDRTTYVTHTAGNVCTLGAGNDVITCDVGLIQPGSSFSFEVEVSLGILPDRTIVSNTVTATSSTTDPDPANNAFVATTTVSAPVMTLTKTASPPSGSDVGPGQRIDYTITYRNTGSLTGSNFVITDTVAAQFGIPTVRNGGIYNQETRTITWTIPAVAPGAVAEVGFSAQLGGSDQRMFIDNIARATVTEMAGIISSNQTRHTLVPPDVLIAKSANAPENSEVRALQVITYTLRISNRGNVDAVGVSVTDDPPSGMTYVRGSTRLDGVPVSDSGGTSALFGPGVSLGTLNRGQARSITFDMQVRGDVRPGQTLENWGYVRWNFGLQVSGDFHHLRVVSRLSPPTLRMSILLQSAQGETIFVTVFNRVVGLLTVTGYEAALLLLLALGALGIGRNLTREISPNLLRRMRE